MHLICICFYLNILIHPPGTEVLNILPFTRGTRIHRIEPIATICPLVFFGLPPSHRVLKGEVFKRGDN